MTTQATESECEACSKWGSGACYALGGPCCGESTPEPPATTTCRIPRCKHDGACQPFADKPHLVFCEKHYLDLVIGTVRSALAEHYAEEEHS